MTERKKTWNLVEFTFLCVFPINTAFFYIHHDLSVVAHFVFLILICIPPLFVQFKLGSHIQKSIVGIFSSYFPIWKGAGIAVVVQLFLICVYHGPVVAEIATYMFISVAQEPYVWGDCSNAWNTLHCTNGPQQNDLTELSPKRAAQEFHKNAFWEITSGIDHIDGFPTWGFTDLARQLPVPMTPIALASVWFLVLIMVAFGGQVFGWLVMLVAPTAVVCTFVVLGYGLGKLDQDPTRNMLRIIFTLPVLDPKEYTSEAFLERCLDAFQHIQLALPLWFAIGPTMGKLTGTGKIRKNLTWLLMTIVYSLMWMLPTLTMAPYLGNMGKKAQVNVLKTFPTKGYPLIFDTMATAFSFLKIPAAYALLFYFSLFLYNLLYLCMAILTIVDNIMEALKPCLERNSINKLFINVVVTFLVIGVINALGVPHTTKAGPYFNTLMCISLNRLVFLFVILVSVGLLVVYVKQNFSIAERIIMGIWFAFSAIATAGAWLYLFIKNDQKLKYNGYVFSETWEIISWIVSAVPFVFVLVGGIHAILAARGNCSQRCISSMYGAADTTTHDNGRTYHRAEPSAPPYTFIDGNSYPLEDLPYKSDQEINRL